MLRVELALGKRSVSVQQRHLSAQASVSHDFEFLDVVRLRFAYATAATPSV
jgi:hypothetical protein